MFMRRGVPVHDADAAVRKLYQGGAVAAIEAAFPGVIVAGTVDRPRLAERVLNDPGALARLEAIVHPLVRESEASFLAECEASGCRIVVIDVPLLLEACGSERVDVIVVVSAEAAVQSARVLSRPGMTAAKFAALMARQMPDSEKRRRAHFIIETGRGIAAAAREVDAILRALAPTP
jgi:dephospho-CoA kinase